MTNLLSHLNEGDPQIHYQSPLLTTFLYTVNSRHITLFEISQDSKFYQVPSLCAVLPSSWEVLPPRVHSDLNFP